MQMRPLGRSGLAAAPLALGGNVFGWTADEGVSFALLDAFVAGGFNLIDTADVYSRWVPGHAGGESEAVIGRWLTARGMRGRVLIATKAGMDMGGANKGLSRAYLVAAIERSLLRLKTDYIDLYQAHQDDAETPQDETLEAFALLIRQGKIRVIGASNYAAPRLASALATSAAKGLPRFETLQPEYNLYARADFEQELAPLCAREELAVLPYFGLAAGFLTGKYRSEADLAQSPRGRSVKRMLNPRGHRILAALDAVAAELRATPAQVALAWLMRRSTAPIASATSLVQLEELMGAVRLTLPPDATRRLEDASVP